MKSRQSVTVLPSPCGSNADVFGQSRLAEVAKRRRKRRSLRECNLRMVTETKADGQSHSMRSSLSLDVMAVEVKTCSQLSGVHQVRTWPKEA
jgi:hypothetical protein